MSSNIGKICLIEWVDSTSWDGWRHLPLPDMRLSHIKTVGFVIKETKKKILISHSFSADTGNVCGTLGIPKAAITNIEVIAGEKDKKK